MRCRSVGRLCGRVCGRVFDRLCGRLRGRLARAERGSAILEFIFLGVVVLVPLIYTIVSVALVQRSVLAVRDAARSAGRAYATTPGTGGDAVAAARAEAAVRLALANQNLPDDAEVRVVGASTSCDGPPIAPSLTPGAEFAICVSRNVALPGIPTILAGRGVRTVGRYVVHVDDFRAAS